MPGVSPRLAALSLVVVGLLAAALALAVVQPFTVGPASYDVGSSVIHFLRLIHGQRLESFISTTPKPLLTVVYGGLHVLTGDWRAISFATIGAFAVAVVLATWLAGRVAGPLAAAFAAVALMASPSLAGELLIASAVPWAMVGWAAAGLAVTAPRPRYALAGIALLLATLARLETLVLVGAALILLVGLWVAGRRTGAALVPRGAWWVLLGFLALPVMLLHDWLLTGDPFFWATVSTRYSEGAGAASLLDPAALTHLLAHRYISMAPFSVLALCGGVWLLRRRHLAIAAGLAALGPGVVALLFFLAVRGTFIASRYAVPIDVAVLFTAGIGAAGVAEAFVGWARRRGARPPLARLTRLGGGRDVTTGGALLTGALAAVLVGWPPALIAPGTQTLAAAAQRLAQNERTAVTVLEVALAGVPGARDQVAGPGQRPITVVVPVPMRTLLAVDLSVPLTRLGSVTVAGLGPTGTVLGRAALVVHDRAADPADPIYQHLEAGTVTTYGGQTLTPLLVQPQTGLWIYAVSGP